MKKKEIVTLALTTALLMTAHAVPASAASNAPESMSQTGSIQTITPRWESTNVVVPSISISGKQISVSVYISPKKSTTSSVGTLYLEKKVGNGWTPVTSWSIDGTGSVSITKTYTGTMGITYRTRVVVTTGVDKIDAKPGDIIFFTGTYDSPGPVSHVGIYVGDGMMLHCGSPIQYANINSSYWQTHFYAFGRL